MISKNVFLLKDVFTNSSSVTIKILNNKGVLQMRRLDFKKLALMSVVGLTTAQSPQSAVGCPVPAELLYTKDHEWVRLEGDTARVGITCFAANELADVVFVDQSNDIEIQQAAVTGTVEAVKTVSDLFAPLSGTVTAVNPLVQSNPELVNQDPYEEGWIYEVKIRDRGQISQLLSAADYKKLIGE